MKFNIEGIIIERPRWNCYDYTITTEAKFINLRPAELRVLCEVLQNITRQLDEEIRYNRYIMEGKH